MGMYTSLHLRETKPIRVKASSFTGDNSQVNSIEIAQTREGSITIFFESKEQLIDTIKRLNEELENLE